MEVHGTKSWKGAVWGTFWLPNERTFVFPHRVLFRVKSEAGNVKIESCSKETIFRHQTHAYTRTAFLAKYLHSLGCPTKIKPLPVKKKTNQSVTQLSVFVQLSHATQISASPQGKFIFQ